MPKQSSAELHNWMCWSYLKAVEHPVEAYDSTQDYGMKYQAFVKDIENNASEKTYKLYHHDFNPLKAYYAEIWPVILSQRPGGVPLEQQIRDYLSQAAATPYKSLSPHESGGKAERLKAIMSKNYKPQHMTNLPSIRCYDWQPNNRTEYRMSTQAQRHEGEVRVSPLFKKFLESKKPYVYFNLLRRDECPKTLVERAFKVCQKESEMTLALEALDSDQVRVITLPAETPLMHHHGFLKRKPSMTYQEAFDCLVASTQDFHLGKTVFDKVKLLEKSFEEMGIKKGERLSEAQQQAVWFHFVNYAVPNFVMEQFNPVGFNFSCKDAIDRGGAASAWFNLMSSFKTDKPMSRDDFEQALHAAPALVKGRGMNAHFYRVWNVVDQYVKAHRDELEQDVQKNWLMHWHEMNCPKACVGEVLQQVLDSDVCPSGVIEFELQAAYKILEIIRDNQKELPKNLSLEIVSRTMAMVRGSIQQIDLERYDKLIKLIKSPKLSILKGIMLTLLGLITFSKSRVSKGVEHVKMGFFSVGEKSKALKESLHTLHTQYKNKS